MTNYATLPATQSEDEDRLTVDPRAGEQVRTLRVSQNHNAAEAGGMENRAP
jgi:hypothetical protein